MSWSSFISNDGDESGEWAVELHHQESENQDNNGQSQGLGRIPAHDQLEQIGEDGEDEEGQWKSEQEEEEEFSYEDREFEIAQQDTDEGERENVLDKEQRRRLSAALCHLAAEVSRWHQSGTSNDSLSESTWSLTPEVSVDEVLSRVDGLVEEQLLSLQTLSPSPAFVYPNLSSWSNVCYCPHRGLVPRFDNRGGAMIKTVTALNHRGSARKYSLLLLLLWEVRRLCLERSFSTRRDIYYRYPNDFNSQSDVDSVASVLTAILRVPRIHLRILATSKGLVAGSLAFVSSQGTETRCYEKSDGEPIPQDVEGISEVHSNANFVLVVEKDATFQKLLDENGLQIMHPCIIVTGKGVPDLNTRQFVRLLWVRLAIPVFALVDADPFGIEIMFTYRFGSLAMAWSCETTAVPAMKWLGVHPSEFQDLDEGSLLALSNADKAKLRSLRKRPYVQDLQELAEEMEIMSEMDAKAEIQSQESPTQYVLDKITARQWV